MWVIKHDTQRGACSATSLSPCAWRDGSSKLVTLTCTTAPTRLPRPRNPPPASSPTIKTPPAQRHDPSRGSTPSSAATERLLLSVCKSPVAWLGWRLLVRALRTEGHCFGVGTHPGAKPLLVRHPKRLLVSESWSNPTRRPPPQPLTGCDKSHPQRLRLQRNEALENSTANETTGIWGQGRLHFEKRSISPSVGEVRHACGGSGFRSRTTWRRVDRETSRQRIRTRGTEKEAY